MTNMLSDTARHAIVAVGSNLGDSTATIARAVKLLEFRLHMVAERSMLYQTEPMYDVAQPSFVNGVIAFEIAAPPFETLAHLLEVEAALGRVRDEDARFGARTIDLDLIAVDRVIVDSSALQLPHPRCHERAFVLRPLVDILPDWMHPRLDRTAKSLLDQLDSSSTNAPVTWKQLDDNRWRSS